MEDLPAELDCYVQQYPIQEVVPRAVRIADAIDAISCTTNLMVSFLVIAFDRFRRLKTWRLRLPAALGFELDGSRMQTGGRISVRFSLGLQTRREGFSVRPVVRGSRCSLFTEVSRLFPFTGRVANHPFSGAGC